jgi:hypothetical protein
LAFFALFWGLIGLSGPPARAAEIKVTLFGQPCILKGPVDEKTLRAIHALSPEQAFPPLDFPPKAEDYKHSLENVKASTGAGAGLDRYRERLTKRLEAQISFIEALEALKRAKKTGPLRELDKRVASPSKLKDFQAQSRKLETMGDLGAGRGKEAAEQLFQSFNDAIEPDPEEEFHGAIHRMNVQYSCTFEENSET